MIEHEDETNNAGQDWARERLRNFLTIITACQYTALL